jgi:hypothetical protein
MARVGHHRCPDEVFRPLAEEPSIVSDESLTTLKRALKVGSLTRFWYVVTMSVRTADGETVWFVCPDGDFDLGTQTGRACCAVLRVPVGPSMGLLRRRL